jgi:putative ABC transport system permease protein
MHTLIQNCRYAFRIFRGSPGFTAVALLSLAVGIGVNTAIFSVFNAVLLKSLPVRSPEQLVYVSIPNGSISYPYYRELRNRNQVLSGLIAASSPGRMAMRAGENEAELAAVSFVSGNFFETLGGATSLGRPLAPSDDQLNANPVGVLGYGIWQRSFAGDRGILGRTITINNHPVTVIGVAARGFRGVYPGSSSDLYLPLTSVGRIRPDFWGWERPNWNWLSVLGRLKPGMPLTQAQASLNIVEPQIREALNLEYARFSPGSKSSKDPEPIRLLPGGSGTPFLKRLLSDPLRILLIATGLVLLIACANVANLLLARAASRQREMAVRLSLGATSRRILSQLLTESMILAGAAGCLGVLLAFWGVDALLALRPAGRDAIDLQVAPDLRILAFSALVSMAAGLLFGLAPAFEASRTNITASMKADVGVTVRGSRMALRKTLVIVQVALSLVLLVAAGLFVRTLRNLLDIDLGFRRENVLVVQTDPAQFGYKGARLRMFYDRLLERTRNTQGVISASLAMITPLSGANRTSDVSFEGYRPQSKGEMILDFNQISERYFATMRIPIQIGRDFTPEDEPAITPEGGFLGGIAGTSGTEAGPPVLPQPRRSAIISESVAHHFFKGTNPIGRRFSYGDPFKASEAFEIVGVVKDVKYSGLRWKPPWMVYVPVWMHGAEPCSLVLRTARDPKQLISTVRQTVRDLDAAIPILQATTVQDDIDNNISNERLIANLSGFFGALSLALAAIGLYGVVTYAVTRRTKEFGIRMALGAERSELIWMVLRESIGLVVVGIAIGAGVAFALTRLVSSLLYGVSAHDPLSIGLAASILFVTSIAAALIPAFRASKLDPMASLRCE